MKLIGFKPDLVAQPPQPLPYPIFLGIDVVQEFRFAVLVAEGNSIFLRSPPLIETVYMNTAIPHLLEIVVAVRGTLVDLNAILCKCLTERTLHRGDSVLPKGTLRAVKEVDCSASSNVLCSRINRPRAIDLLK